MEPIAKTWTVLEQVGSSDLNQLQQNAVAVRPASGTATNDWSAIANGTQGVIFQSATAFANATVYTLDASIDWRDRILVGWFFESGAANTQPGGANDANYTSAAGTWEQFMFYTGTGATDAGAALVSNGNPPALGYYLTLTTISGLSIFCDTGAGGGKLRIYNGTGGAIQSPGFYVQATPDLGKR